MGILTTDDVNEILANIARTIRDLERGEKSRYQFLTACCDYDISLERHGETDELSIGITIHHWENSSKGKE